MNPHARRKARENALQAIYQWQLAPLSAADIEAQFIAHQNMKKVDLIYFRDILHGTIHQRENLDQQMVSFLDRPVEELDPVELAVLRLAIYELSERLDIPYRVIINEALELTKKFGSVEGYKYVNGILDRVAKKLRATEMERTQ